jgi:hypothetical protein
MGLNLHAIVSPVIGAVNQSIPVTVRISVGTVTNPDGSRTPAYETPGSLTGSVSGTTLTVTAVASGYLAAGQLLADAGPSLLPGTTITDQIGGTPGGIGTYSVNQPQTVASEAMTTSLTVLAQIQAMTTRDLRQMEGLNLQGTYRAMYVTGDINGVVRVLLKGGDLVVTPNGWTWLVTLVPEPWSMTAGWTKVICALQDGS